LQRSFGIAYPFSERRCIFSGATPRCASPITTDAEGGGELDVAISPELTLGCSCLGKRLQGSLKMRAIVGIYNERKGWQRRGRRRHGTFREFISDHEPRSRSASRRGITRQPEPASRIILALGLPCRSTMARAASRHVSWGGWTDSLRGMGRPFAEWGGTSREL